jgi:ribosomal protein L3
MSTQPLESLELRALEQRNRLHQDATELKEKMAAAREKLSVARNVREHFTHAALVMTIAGLLAGHGFAGMFTRR